MIIAESPVSEQEMEGICRTAKMAHGNPRMAQRRNVPPKPHRDLSELNRELEQASDAQRAHNLAWFFKTGKGEYAEGDEFCGITVPALRKICNRYKHLPLSSLRRLLRSRIHEHRLAALMILATQYDTSEAELRKKLFDFYLANTRYINNWDLVDASARAIVGEYLVSGSRKLLYKLAGSSNLWERRISIIATHAFIRRGDLDDTFAIAELLLSDEHDLIHKAVGWMLREAGKQSELKLLAFLQTHYSEMSRTTLRYAIERIPEAQRKMILKGEFQSPPSSSI